MNNGRPVAPEGYEPPAGQLALRVEPVAPRGGSPVARAVFGVLWSSVGSAFVPVAPVLANMLVAFGATLAYGNAGRRGQVMSLLAAVAAGAASTYFVQGVQGFPMTLVSIACAFALAWALVSGRLRTGVLLFVAALTMLAMIGTDMVSTSLEGTSITALVTSVVDEVVDSSVGSLDLEGKTALLEARDELLVYWPTIYFAVAATMALCSLLGARMAARASDVATPSLIEAIIAYDVPLWVAVLFALGAIAQMVGPSLPAWQDALTMVGANVVMSTRIALAQQGLSVLQWWMREHRVGWSARALVVLVAVWLEMAFALASAVGLLDVAVNFRHLKRERPDLVLGPTGER